MPHLAIAFGSPWDSKKNKLELGGIAPHLGEIWGFECSYFGLHFLEILSSEFRIFFHVARTNLLLSILRI